MLRLGSAPSSSASPYRTGAQLRDAPLLGPMIWKNTNKDVLRPTNPDEQIKTAEIMGLKSDAGFGLKIQLCFSFTSDL